MEAEDDRFEPKVSKKRQRELLSVEEYNAKAWERLLKHSTESTEPPPLGLEKPCRLFNAFVDNGGYGKISYRKTQMPAHRVSLMITLNTNSLPKTNNNGETMHARHLCNNQVCIEPTHILLGTIAENGEDKVKNGLLKGEKNSAATITEETARNIKLSFFPKGHKDYKTCKEIAIFFGVKKTVVDKIKSNRAWSWLPSVDGSTSEEKAKSIKAQQQKNSKLAMEKIWTIADWDKAKAKLNDPKYVKMSETLSLNGIFCKEWIKSKDKNGYGKTQINNVAFKAHVLACVISNNFVRPKNLYVRHLCGNRSCVEGEHLKFGTQEENLKDAIFHGTLKTKVSTEQVVELRKLYVAGGITQKELGKIYGISEGQVSGIINKKKRKYE
jgi:hypothetical protein